MIDFLSNEIEMADFDGGFLLSPMADSNESLISETSARNDRAKADLLELRSPEAEIYKIAEEFYNSRNPLMTSQSADNIYTVPRRLEEKLREREEEEHIYEELDNIRPSVSYSNLASVYASVPPEYEEIPPLLPPRRRKELTPDFLTTDSNPLLSQWLPDTPEATLSKASSPEVPRGQDSSLSSKSSTSSSSSEEADAEKPSSDESLGTTTADSSDSFVEVLEEDWPPPPSIMRGRKKVHPDGHVFPRITSSVNLMPLLPEDKEISSSEVEEVGGIKLSPVVDIDMFSREPKPGSPLNSSISSSSSEDESKVPTLPSPLLADDLPYMDASPRPA